MTNISKWKTYITLTKRECEINTDYVVSEKHLTISGSGWRIYTLSSCSLSLIYVPNHINVIDK